MFGENGARRCRDDFPSLARRHDGTAALAYPGRPRGHAGAGRGHRGHRRLLPHVATRTSTASSSPARRRTRSSRPRARRWPPSWARRQRTHDLARPEHDDALLFARARPRPRAQAGRRGRGDAARPRSQPRALADACASGGRRCRKSGSVRTAASTTTTWRRRSARAPASSPWASPRTPSAPSTTPRSRALSRGRWARGSSSTPCTTRRTSRWT